MERERLREISIEEIDNGFLVNHDDLDSDSGFGRTQVFCHTLENALDVVEVRLGEHGEAGSIRGPEPKEGESKGK